MAANFNANDALNPPPRAGPPRQQPPAPFVAAVEDYNNDIPAPHNYYEHYRHNASAFPTGKTVDDPRDYTLMAVGDQLNLNSSRAQRRPAPDANDTYANRFDAHRTLVRDQTTQNHRNMREHAEKTRQCVFAPVNPDMGAYAPPKLFQANVHGALPIWDRCDPERIFKEKNFYTVTENELTGFAYKALMEKHNDTAKVERLLAKALPWARGAARESKTIARAMVTILHFTLLINKTVLTEQMKEDKIFSTVVKAQDSLTSMKQTCFSFLIQAFLVCPTMMEKKYGNICQQKNKELYHDVILPLVSNVCTFWSPTELTWNYQLIVNKTCGRQFRKRAIEKMGKGMWSIEEVNDLDIGLMDNAEIKEMMNKLLFEFAVVCMYCVSGFEDHLRKGGKWIVTAHQKSNEFWTAISNKKIFPTGGAQLQEHRSQGVATGYVSHDGRHSIYQYKADDNTGTKNIRFTGQKH